MHHRQSAKLDALANVLAEIFASSTPRALGDADAKLHAPWCLRQCVAFRPLYRADELIE